MPVSLTVENIEKKFGQFPALRGVSMTVAPGELMALLGPSGSGKTTLLRAIAGLEQVEKGRVLFDDIDAESLSFRDRRIGFVFQHYALFRHLSVYENVAFGLRARPRRERPNEGEIHKRVNNLLDLVQLGELGARFPSQLSGGQRQRVALARALAIEPRILLLDEPFGALDAQVRKDLRQWLREFHTRIGQTTLFVTHDQAEATELADRVAILNHGIIEQLASSHEIYEHPQTPFVCKFLGETNVIPVELKGGQAYFDGYRVYDATNYADGTADLYIRPYLFKLAQPGSSPLSGIITHVHQTGPYWRAELTVGNLAKPLTIEGLTRPLPILGEHVAATIESAHLFKTP
jgi:sulfate transport system ATP-binding protein